MKNWTGKYAVKSEYYKELDPFWPYLPVYLKKISIVRKPSKVIGLHRIYNRLLTIPGLCFLNIFLCEKKETYANFVN